MPDNRAPNYNPTPRSEQEADDRDDHESQNGFEEATYEDLPDEDDDELTVGDDSDEADDGDDEPHQTPMPARATPPRPQASSVARSADELLNSHVAPHLPKKKQKEPALLYRCYPLNSGGHRIRDEEVTIVGRRTESDIQQHLIEAKPVLRGSWEVLVCQVGVDARGKRRERVVDTKFIRTDVQISRPGERGEYVGDADPAPNDEVVGYNEPWGDDDLPPLPAFDTPAEEPMLGGDGNGDMGSMFRTLAQTMQQATRDQQAMLRYLVDSQRQQPPPPRMDLTTTLGGIRDALPAITSVIELVRPKSDASQMMELFFKGMEAKTKSDTPGFRDWLPILAIALTGNPAMQPVIEWMAKRLVGMDPGMAAAAGAPAPAAIPAAPAPAALPAPAPAGTPTPAASQPEAAAPAPATPQPQPQKAAAEAKYSTANARKWRQGTTWRAIDVMMAGGNRRFSRSNYWAERIFCEFEPQAILDLLALSAEDVATELLEVAPNVKNAVLSQLPESERTDSAKAEQQVRAAVVNWCTDLLRQIRENQDESTGTGEDAGDDD